VTWKGSLIEVPARSRRRRVAQSESSRQLGRALGGCDGRQDEPEELIAAAHASCFSMALSSGLAKAGTPPDELNTSATVTFSGCGNHEDRTHREGSVPGLDDEAFTRQRRPRRRTAPCRRRLQECRITLDTRYAERRHGRRLRNLIDELEHQYSRCSSVCRPVGLQRHGRQRRLDAS